MASPLPLHASFMNEMKAGRQEVLGSDLRRESKIKRVSWSPLFEEVEMVIFSTTGTSNRLSEYARS